jgi:hypothetical protein
VATPHPSGHGAAHALLQRGEFRETGLAGKPNPAIRETAGWERRPFLVVKFLSARLKSIHSDADFIHSLFAPSFSFFIFIFNSEFGRFNFHDITAFL